MRTDQIERLEKLRDRLIDVALVDADPTLWVGAGKKPNELTREERGDAKWCRSVATSTVALTLQVQRLLQNPAAGGAIVPDRPGNATAGTPPAEVDENELVEAEVSRYEKAAARIVDRARRGKR